MPDIVVNFLEFWGFDQDWQKFATWFRVYGMHATKWFLLGIVISFILRKLITVRLLVRLSPMGAPRNPEQQKRANTLASVVLGTGNIILWGIILTLIFTSFGFSVGALLASAGIASLAVALGAQSIVKDVIAGFFVLMENHYNIGDVVDISGVSGRVEEINIRTTVLRDLKGSVHIIPNGQIMMVTNRTRQWAQVVLDTAIAPKENIDRATAVIKRVSKDLMENATFRQAVMGAPRVLGVDEVSKDQIVIRSLIRTAPTKQWSVERILRKNIKQAFDEEGIKVVE